MSGLILILLSSLSVTTVDGRELEVGTSDVGWSYFLFSISIFPSPSFVLFL